MMPQLYSIPRKLLTLVLLMGSLLLSASVFAAPAAQTLQQFDYRSDPVLQVASYYNAINLHDYQRAFGYWETPPSTTPTLAQFTAGFADTQRVSGYVGLPVFEGVGAGNAYADVPVILISQHTDGSMQPYVGCIRTHKVNVPVGDATEPDPNWHLQNASIQPTAGFDTNMLHTACDALQGGDPAGGSYNSQFSPVDVLTSYYDAINNRDYARAFGYWESPPSTTPTLEQFAAGFANTQSVQVILGMDASGGGAAGSAYASLPVLVRATQTSGDIISYTGCFTTRKSNVPVGSATEPDPNWHLYSAHLTAIQNQALNDPLNLLNGVCQV